MDPRVTKAEAESISAALHELGFLRPAGQSDKGTHRSPTAEEAGMALLVLEDGKEVLIVLDEGEQKPPRGP